MSCFDAAIVGASLAGACTAFLLGRKGYSVALYDKNAFPRSKPCGEGLSHIGCSVLKACGLGAQLDGLAHTPFDGFSIVTASSANAISLRRSGQAGIGIERRLLDTAIVQVASAQPSVVTQLGHKVQSVIPVSQGWRLTSTSGDLYARSLIIADGLLSPTAGVLGIHRTSIESPRFGLRLFIDCKRPHTLSTVTIFVRQNREWFCTPVSSTRLNLSLLGGAPDVARLKADRALHGEMRLLLDALDIEGTIADEIGGRGPFSCRSEVAAKENVFFVGDACETFDPRCGMGMTHALLNARLASYIIPEALSGHVPWKYAARKYVQQEKTIASALRNMDWLTAWTLNRAQRGSRILPFLSKAPVVDLTHALLTRRLPKWWNEA